MMNDKIKKNTIRNSSNKRRSTTLPTARIQTFLDGFYIQYTMHTNVVAESTSQLSRFAKSINTCALKVVLFSDERGPVLVVYPADDGLDFEMLRKVTKRNLMLDAGLKFKHQLQGFPVCNLPPFGRLFQMMMVVDDRLQSHNSFLIDIGKEDTFIQIDNKGLDILLKGSVKKQFSAVIPEAARPIEVDDSQSSAGKNKPIEINKSLLTVDAIESVFSRGQSLPVIPEVGEQLVALKGKGDFELVDLVHLIESDPMLSAKIIAYASSSFFSYQGKLDSVQEAVYHVLGLDLSLNISLALAVGEQFKGPMRGAVGAMATWRHGVYCAVLSQSIASKLKNQPGLRPGSAYLHGLLHNIGFLALGHLFPKKIAAFNKALESKGERNFDLMEKTILGVGHAKVGGLLMESWSLPDEYRVVVENHHDGAYSGEYEVYSHIVYISNILLKSINIGDSSDEIVPDELMKKYDLNEAALQDMLQIVVQWNESIDHLAQQLAA